MILMKISGYFYEKNFRFYSHRSVMYPDACCRMHKYFVRSYPGSRRHGCDIPGSPAGSNPCDRTNLDRNLGLDI